jgi:hypothetical protein
MKPTTVPKLYKYKNGKVWTGTLSLYVHVRPSKTRTECKQLYACDGRNNLSCQWSVLLRFFRPFLCSELKYFYVSVWSVTCFQLVDPFIDRLHWFYRFAMQEPYRAHVQSVLVCLSSLSVCNFFRLLFWLLDRTRAASLVLFFPRSKKKRIAEW